MRVASTVSGSRAASKPVDQKKARTARCERPFLSWGFTEPPSTPPKKDAPTPMATTGGAKASKVPLWVLPLLAAPRFSWRRPKDRANGRCGAKTDSCPAWRGTAYGGAIQDSNCRPASTPRAFLDFDKIRWSAYETLSLCRSG